MANYQKDIEPLAKDISHLSAGIVDLKVTSDPEAKSATGLLTSVKTKAKEIAKKKKAILDPLSEAVKEVRKLFKEPEDQLTEAERIIKAAILAYHEAQDAIAQKQIASIENRVGEGRGHIKVETAMAQLANVNQADTNIRTENGGAQIRMGAEKVKITDPYFLPPEYLYRERVLEALRIEVANDLRNGVIAECPAGAEVYREKVVAGV